MWTVGAWEFTTEGVVAAAAIIVVAGPVIARSLHRLRSRRSQRLARADAGFRHTAEMGVVEQVVCAVAVYIGRPEIIGAWLVLKVATKWQDPRPAPGDFNLFLVGTGASIGAAAIAARALAVRTSADWAEFVVLLGGYVLVGALILVIGQGPRWIGRLFDPEYETSSD